LATSLHKTRIFGVVHARFVAIVAGDLKSAWPLIQRSEQLAQAALERSDATPRLA
jgi:hypothetical protein